MLYHPMGEEIVPGCRGEDCPCSLGKYMEKTGEFIHYCTTCPYLKCCVKVFDNRLCKICYEKDCPRSGKKSL